MKLRFFKSLSLSIMIGYYITTNLSVSILNYNRECVTKEEEPLGANNNKDLILVGVITTKDFIKTRARAIYDTWYNQIPGKVIFFTSENTELVPDLPIVRLNGTNDNYPPMNKTLLMIKYMNDHYVDDFHFFMRADDDLHIRSDLLLPYLTSISNKVPRHIGQMGRGNPEDKGKLGLEKGEYFCMGGPGIIWNHFILSGIGPNIDKCLELVQSKWDDVELFRWIKAFVDPTKANCTTDTKLTRVFYHSYSEDLEQTIQKGFRYKDILKRITMHPVKDSPLQYKLFIDLQIFNIRNKEAEVMEELQRIERIENLHNNFIDNPRQGCFKPILDFLENKKAFILFNETISFVPKLGDVKAQGLLTAYNFMLESPEIVSRPLNKILSHKEASLYTRNFPGKFAEYFLDQDYFVKNKRTLRANKWYIKGMSSKTSHVIVNYSLLWIREVNKIKIENDKSDMEKMFND